MRSTIVWPAGVVWSKKPRETMFALWPSAASRRRALARSSGSPRSQRIWLCRHRIASRIRSPLLPSGARSASTQPSCALWARWSVVALVPVYVQSALARMSRWLACEAIAAAGVSRPVQNSDTARMRVRRSEGVAFELPQNVVSGSSAVTKCRMLDTFGGPAGSWSPVALRPVLADGLPFRRGGSRLFRMIVAPSATRSVVATERCVGICAPQAGPMNSRAKERSERVRLPKSAAARSCPSRG